MIFGYADNSIDKLNVDKMFFDVVSHHTRSRPNLEKLLNEVRPGDLILVKSLSQLGWGIRSVILMINKMMKQDVILKDVNNYVNTECESTIKIISSIFDIDKRRFEKVKTSTYPKQRFYIDEKLWNAYYTLWKNKSITKTEWRKAMSIKPTTFYQRFKQFTNKFKE